ncbi:glycosyltransferase family 61 protein [Shewanella maritima]|uniref:glycosyltransferase family 61 protein n=1 Tax=Shewanella maritima TaxID=2520507 RepID=UPI003735F107
MFRSWFEKERIIIFGTGGMAKKLSKDLPFSVNVLGYSDNNAATHGKRFLGKPIIAPKDIESIDVDYVVIASQSYKAIEEGLLAQKIISKEKIAYFSKYEIKPSALKEQTIKWSFEFFSYWLNPVTRSMSHQLFVEPGCQLTPINWLDTQSASILKEIEPQAIFTGQGPKFIEKPQQFAKVNMPAVRAYQFSNTCIESASRLFIQHDKALLERGLEKDSFQGDFCGGAIVQQSQTAVIHKQYPTLELEKGIVINGVAESNYYHCIIEILSQLYYLDKLGAEYDDYPLLISKNMLAIPSVNDCFNSLNITRQVIPLTAGHFYNVKQLLAITTPNNNLAINLNYGHCEPSQNYFRQNSLDYIREHSLALLNNNKVEANRRIFMARKGPIRSYNQQAVFELLAQYNFELVHTEEMTFLEQVALMQQSQYVVGPTGAAWTNLLFANSGTKALCWQAENLANFSCFSNLANIYGVDLAYLTYSTRAKSTRDLFYESYQIDIDKIESWLKSINLQVVSSRDE